MPVNHSSCVDRLLDYVPDLMEKVNCMMNKHMKCKKEQTDEIINQIKENSSKENVVKKDVKKPESKVETTYEFEYDQMEDEQKISFANLFVPKLGVNCQQKLS